MVATPPVGAVTGGVAVFWAFVPASRRLLIGSRVRPVTKVFDEVKGVPGVLVDQGLELRELRLPAWADQSGGFEPPPQAVDRLEKRIRGGHIAPFAWANVAATASMINSTWWAGAISYPVDQYHAQYPGSDLYLSQMTSFLA